MTLPAQWITADVPSLSAADFAELQQRAAALAEQYDALAPTEQVLLENLLRAINTRAGAELEQRALRVTITHGTPVSSPLSGSTLLYVALAAAAALVLLVFSGGDRR